MKNCIKIFVILILFSLINYTLLSANSFTSLKDSSNNVFLDVPTKFSNYSFNDDSFLFTLNLDKPLFLYNNSTYNWNDFFEKKSISEFNSWNINEEKKIKIKVPKYKKYFLEVLQNGDTVIGVSKFDSSSVLFNNFKIENDVLIFSLPETIPDNAYIFIDYFLFGSFDEISKRWGELSSIKLRKIIDKIDNCAFSNNSISNDYVSNNKFLDKTHKYFEQNDLFPSLTITNQYKNFSLNVSINRDDYKQSIFPQKSFSYKVKTFNDENISIEKFNLELDVNCLHCQPLKIIKHVEVNKYGDDILIHSNDLFPTSFQKCVIFKNDPKDVRIVVKNSTKFENNIFIGIHEDVTFVFSKDYFSDYTYTTNSGHYGEKNFEIDIESLEKKFKRNPFPTIVIKNISNNKGSVLIKVDEIVIDSLKFSPNEEKQIHLDRYDYFSDLNDAKIVVVDENDLDEFQNVFVTRKIRNDQFAPDELIELELKYIDVIKRLSINDSTNLYKNIIRYYSKTTMPKVEKKNKIRNLLKQNNINNPEDLKEFLEIGISQKINDNFNTSDIDVLIQFVF